MQESHKTAFKTLQYDSLINSDQELVNKHKEMIFSESLWIAVTVLLPHAYAL